MLYLALVDSFAWRPNSGVVRPWFDKITGLAAPKNDARGQRLEAYKYTMSHGTFVGIG